MKFRGVMLECIPMRELHNIVNTLSKICKECVLRLTTESLYLIVTEESGGPRVWCHIQQASFFSEYNMEGVDQQHKDIYLGLVTGNLARSVATLKQHAKSIKIKLTNKQHPCLSLEIELPSLNLLHTRQVTHDVPVTVIPRKSWKNYSEPTVETYHISIEMPSLKQLRSMVDRMKSMSPELIIEANSSGQFVLQIRTDMAVVSSRWQNLTVVHFNDADARSDDDDEDHRDTGYIVCHIDIKKFFMFLNADQITHSRVVCSMRHNNLVNLFIEHEGILSFQCFIPALIH